MVPPLEEDARRQEPRELPEPPVERPEGREIGPCAAAAQNGSERLLWWRRGRSADAHERRAVLRVRYVFSEALEGLETRPRRC